MTYEVSRSEISLEKSQINHSIMFETQLQTINETDITPCFHISSSVPEKILSNFDPKYREASMYKMILENEQPNLTERGFC